MSVTWKCDRCGLEQTGTQIVGHEFDYSKNFGSLAYEVEGMRDLCTRCMEVANKAARDATDQLVEMKRQAVTKALSRENTSNNFWSFVGGIGRG